MQWLKIFIQKPPHTLMSNGCSCNQFFMSPHKRHRHHHEDIKSCSCTISLWKHQHKMSSYHKKWEKNLLLSFFSFSAHKRCHSISIWKFHHKFHLCHISSSTKKMRNKKRVKLWKIMCACQKFVNTVVLCLNSWVNLKTSS